MGQYKPDGLKHLPESGYSNDQKKLKGSDYEQSTILHKHKNVTMQPIILYANYKLFESFLNV